MTKDKMSPNEQCAPDPDLQQVVSAMRQRAQRQRKRKCIGCGRPATAIELFFTIRNAPLCACCYRGRRRPRVQRAIAKVAKFPLAEAVFDEDACDALPTLPPLK